MNPGCPDDCPDKELHQQYADRLAEWERVHGLDLVSTATDPAYSVVHKLEGLERLGAIHDRTCSLLFGARSLVREIVAGMSILLDIPVDEIGPSTRLTCVETSDLEAFTFKIGPIVNQSNRIMFSHGFHWLILNLKTTQTY